MSLFTKMFGGGKGAKPPTTGEAIQKLRETEEMLIKKQDFLEKKIQDELKVAKQNGTKNKRGQCYCLGRFLNDFFFLYLVSACRFFTILQFCFITV